MKKRCIVAYLFLFSNILFASYENFNGKDVSGQSFRSDYSLTYSTWISATAIGTDFGYANLGGANFSNAQSNNANFEYATFLVDWGIDEPQPNYANFNNAIINGASFNGTVDKGFLAENLYSTGSYKNKDLSNIRLGINNLTGWNFSNQNLKGAYFGGATLTNANFTGANINSVDFSGANGFTYDMFKSTQTFKDKNIKGVNFAISPRIDSWDFSGLTINNCNFTELYANVTYGELYYCNFNNTDLRNSSLKKTTGTTFTDAKINSSQINISIDALKNTWSYKNKNLRDIDFYDTNLVSDLTEMDLSNATFEKCTLIRFIRDGSGWGSAYAGINMYNSIINGADFSKAVIFDKVTSAPEGFKYQAFYNIETLYNTLSYKNRDLSNIHFGYFMFSGNFKWQNLQNSQFWRNNTNIFNLSFADIRGSNISGDTDIFYNTISKDGIFKSFSMASSADNFSIRKYTPATEGGVTISAKFASDSAVSGDATLTLEQGAEVEVIDTAVLSFDAESTLAINTNVDGISTFTIGDNAGLIFEDGATLNINLEGTVDVDTPYTFSALNWSETSTINGIENLIKDSTLFLSINGSLLTGNWESLVKDNGLFISMNAVPEPATYAAIFGALALALAVARRRR